MIERLQKFNEANKKVNKEKAVELYSSGLSCLDIAKYFKASKQSVLRFLIKDYCDLHNKQIKDLTEIDLINSYFYDFSNGITLCEGCHKKWHKLHGR